MSVVLLRHAWAGERGDWADDDMPRPLDERGRKQAVALSDLAQRGVGRVVSSPYRRCIESVEPLARALGIPIELDDRLTEGATQLQTLELLNQLDGGLACTHGDVIEAVLGYGLRKGAAVVIEAGPDGVTVLEALPAP
jgi:phosphohistidine phosphatase SixA